MTFGEKITLLRKQKNLSQVELAEQVGITRDSIGKYERNDIVPTIEKAKKMADLLGVSLDYLVDEKEISPIETILDKDMIFRIKQINKLPEKDRDKILSIVDAFIRDYNAKQAYSGV
ncbi:MAG: helix-turn-helix transcriptional regulator [Bacteroidota bacterium]|nr:helix-turn-helix transcriptional regulator [Bacteroidota bacterium]